jgi:hypothetical protein
LKVCNLKRGGVSREKRVAAKLGYPWGWLIKLRKEGIINPVRPGGFWLYSEEQVKQIPSLIAETRKCQRCGKPRPVGSHRLCRECSHYRSNHWYQYLSLEEKAKYRARNRASGIPPIL